jgi:hypothetical protein
MTPFLNGGDPLREWGGPHRPIDPIREWGVAIREWLYSCMDYNICFAVNRGEWRHKLARTSCFSRQRHEGQYIQQLFYDGSRTEFICPTELLACIVQVNHPPSICAYKRAIDCHAREPGSRSSPDSDQLAPHSRSACRAWAVASHTGQARSLLEVLK